MLLTDLIFVNHLVAAHWGWRHDFLPFPTLYPGHNFCSYFCNKGRIMKKKNLFKLSMEDSLCVVLLLRLNTQNIHE